MSKGLYSPYNTYLLYDAVWSGTAPQTTYDLDTFAALRPDMRVRFPGTSATVTATIGASRRADVFALPMSNITPGSTTILSLTNGAGFNSNIPIPAMPSDSIPLTVVLDMRGIASAGTRTSNVWNTVVTSNGVAVTLGGLIWLGQLTELTDDINYNFVRGETRFNGSKPNFFGTINRVRARTRVRYEEFTIVSKNAQRLLLLDWMRAGEGAGLPSLFWSVPSIADALVGMWGDENQVPQQLKNGYWVKGRFTELSKGIPLL